VANNAMAKINVDRFSATVTAIHRHATLSRVGIHWSRGRVRLGTLMRYFICRRWGFSNAIAGTCPESRLPTGGVTFAIEGVPIDLVGSTQGSSTLTL